MGPRLTKTAKKEVIKGVETEITSITLNTAHLDSMLRFFLALGLECFPKEVEKGGGYYRGFCGSVEINLYNLPSAVRERAPNFQLSFSVSELDRRFARLCEIPGVQSVMDPTLLPGGKKAILIDPDGRSVELTEKT